MSRHERRTTHSFARCCRCLLAAVVAALLFLALSGGSLAGTRGRPTTSHVGTRVDGTAAMTPTATAVAAVPVTLQEACRTEMRVHCGDHAASPLRCLLEHYDRTATTNHHGGSPRQQSAALYSGVCASWLVARATCLGFVHKHAGGLCGSAVRDARECLRQIPPVALPPTCVMSDYYGSVQLIGKLRQHQSADLRAA